MAIAVVYNPADIDATVTAAMLKNVCEYDIVSNTSTLDDCHKVISLGNMVFKDQVNSKTSWIVINKLSHLDDKPTNRSFIGSILSKDDIVPPTQTIRPTANSNGEIISYGSYLRHYSNLLDLEDRMTEEALSKYEYLCHDMSTCVRMMDLHDQSILWGLQRNAREYISKEVPELILNLVDGSFGDNYNDFQKFLKEIKREISEKICTETVLIRRKSFDKMVQKVVGVQTINTNMWKAPWIFKITSHITPAICVFEHIKDNRIHMKTKHFNQDGEIAINNIMSERNLRWVL